MRILNAAAQTRGALILKLRRGGYSSAAAEGACDRAVGLGYVNDAAYAEALVERRMRQGRGAGLLRRELGHRGLDDEVVSMAMGAIAPEDELASALDLAGRLCKRYSNEAEPARRRDKVLASMARRGFSGSVARRAFAEAQSRLD
ncbi:MAG: hypothetical protein NVSMB17_07440 [Candidatus Dormibacteria bacterium]